MTRFSTNQVAELIGLNAPQIRRCVQRELINPERGRAGEFRFEFRDVVLLRTWKRLLDARVSAQRASRALGQLRSQLSASQTLSGIRVLAVGCSVVTRADQALWEAETGQGCFDFEPADSVGEITRIDPESVILLRELDGFDSDAWYNLGLDLEDVDAARAAEAYRRAIDIDPANVDAHVNLGRLAQLGGDLMEAIDCYRRALAFAPSHALALYNLGTVYDELDEFEQALRLYMQAASVPDAHFNCSRIFERLGDQVSARRHLRNYERMLNA
ncbi:MAG: tetratricopeptide repeat protein [Pseudomonadales bacterium]